MCQRTNFKGQSNKYVSGETQQRTQKPPLKVAPTNLAQRTRQTKPITARVHSLTVEATNWDEPKREN